MSTVNQRAYEAAQVLFDDILGDAASYAEFNRPSYREAAVRTLTEAFARFEREISTNKDETIAKAVNSVVDAVIGSNADLLRDSGATYRRCCMAARDAARAALTSTKKEG